LITAYRIVKKKYADSPLSGRGGLDSGGRWHGKGVLVAYCAQSLSLAALEFFVHFGRHERHIALVSIEIGIPEGLVEAVTLDQLPYHWRSQPPLAATANLGMEWLASARSAVLQVPSAISRGEHNYLINASHPRASKVRARPAKLYTFDSRMWQ